MLCKSAWQLLVLIVLEWEKEREREREKEKKKKGGRGGGEKMILLLKSNVTELILWLFTDISYNQDACLYIM